MSREAPPSSTIRALFAKSGNVCAFPECTHELVTKDNLYVAEVCHIEAANPRGARYKSIQPQRRPAKLQQPNDSLSCSSSPH